jgi:predicted nucleotidyltransferase
VDKKSLEIDSILNKVCEYLKQRMNVSAIFLFGSQSSSRQTAYSDIDLAIFSKDVAKWTVEERVKSVVKIRRLFGLEIEPHFFSDRDLKRASATSFAGHIMRTGKKIA